MYLKSIQTFLSVDVEWRMAHQKGLEARSPLSSTSQRKPAGTAKENQDVWLERQAFLVHSKTIVALGFLKNFAFCSSYCYFAVFKWAGNWNRWTSEILSNLNVFPWPCYILTQDNGIINFRVKGRTVPLQRDIPSSLISVVWYFLLGKRSYVFKIWHGCSLVLLLTCK